LILDDYHVITEQQVHATLWYLIDRLPPQLHLILATRADPPLPLSLLHERRQVLEVRTEQLRCTTEETRAFFHQVVGIQLPDQTIQEVGSRMEGWLVGLHLLGLSLPEHVDPLTLLQQISGEHRYILDYLTEAVLQKQPKEVQMFLLCTSILERLSASLCDAVMQQPGSQDLLERLEKANAFVVSLDHRRQWYRYHTLFAEALLHHLEQMQPDLLPLLHHRASLWYAQRDQTMEAILHALKANQWQWAADLIECKSLVLNALSWGVSHYQLFLLRDWLMQIPADVISARPGFCLACIWMMLFIAPQTVLESWLNAVETTLTNALIQAGHQESAPLMLVSQMRQKLDNMRGEAIAYRALLKIFDEDGEAALALCQQAQALLSADNYGARSHIAAASLKASYTSSVNDAAAAIQIGLQASSLNQTTGNTDQAISLMGVTAMHLIGTGHLHEAQRQAQQAILLGKKSDAYVPPAVGWPMVWQAEVLREWNQLDAALFCIEEAIKLLAELEWTTSLLNVFVGHTIRLRISLSCRELDIASSALQEVEHIGMKMPLPVSSYYGSYFTTIDKVRLWLERGELDHARRWAEQLDVRGQHFTPFARERQEVARARILLAKDQPTTALQHLEPAGQRATVGQRWGHVIEIRLLQALAHQKLDKEPQALVALSEAVRLGEPEGYIRSFVDEGAPIATLLSDLREEQRQTGPTPYLDTLLAAFAKESKWPKRPSKQSRSRRLS
jgi:LuxR family maltose regulon positive regulatory protein